MSAIWGLAPKNATKVALVFCLSLSLQACGGVPKFANPGAWFDGDDDGGGYPSLAAGPERTADEPDRAERRQIANALVADLQRARYTREALRGDGSIVNPSARLAVAPRNVVPLTPRPATPGDDNLRVPRPSDRLATAPESADPAPEGQLIPEDQSQDIEVTRVPAPATPRVGGPEVTSEGMEALSSDALGIESPSGLDAAEEPADDEAGVEDGAAATDPDKGAFLIVPQKGRDKIFQEKFAESAKAVRKRQRQTSFQMSSAPDLSLVLARAFGADSKAGNSIQFASATHDDRLTAKIVLASQLRSASMVEVAAAGLDTDRDEDVVLARANGAGVIVVRKGIVLRVDGEETPQDTTFALAEADVSATPESKPVPDAKIYFSTGSGDILPTDLKKLETIADLQLSTGQSVRLVARPLTSAAPDSREALAMAQEVSDRIESLGVASDALKVEVATETTDAVGSADRESMIGSAALDGLVEVFVE